MSCLFWFGSYFIKSNVKIIIFFAPDIICLLIFCIVRNIVRKSQKVLHLPLFCRLLTQNLINWRALLHIFVQSHWLKISNFYSLNLVNENKWDNFKIFWMFHVVLTGMINRNWWNCIFYESRLNEISILFVPYINMLFLLSAKPKRNEPTSLFCPILSSFKHTLQRVTETWN